MTIAASAIRTHHDLYIGGAWVPAASGRDVRGRETRTRARSWGPSRPERARTPSGRSRQPRRHSLPGRRPLRPLASGSSWQPPTSSSVGGTKSSRYSPAKRAARSASRCSRWGSCRGCSVRRLASPTTRSVRSSRPMSPAHSRWACVVRSGVVAAIAPWNAALILSARSIAAPMVAGNTVVFKPSPSSPFVGGLLWAEIFEEAGLPAGVLNVVTHDHGDGSKIGDEFAENPKVRRINFTGSSATGRRIAEAAGRNLKRVVLELGGQNPLLVLRDADLDYAVNAAAFGAYLHQGQICMSTRRIIVEAPIAAKFEAATGGEGGGSQDGRSTRDGHDHRPADQPGGLRPRFESRRRRRQGLAPVSSPAADPRGWSTPRRCSLMSRSRATSPGTKRSVRSQLSKSSPMRMPGSLERMRPRTVCRPGSSPPTPTRAWPSPIGSRPASSTSTSRPSATNRRCHSAASRTAGGAASVALPPSTSSPS